MANDSLGLDDLIDDWNPIMLEYPFVRKGMTLREYLEEKGYYKCLIMDMVNKKDDRVVEHCKRYLEI